MSVIGLAEMGAAMQKFAWVDYLVFVMMLLVCIVVGIYFGFMRVSENATDYLVGGRNMNTFPVSMSLIASFISGISLLGTPTEVYVYGVQYMYIAGGVIIMGIVMGLVYLPVFHELQLTSTYEYLERRFDKKMRLLGSVLFSIGIITWLPIVIYVPALAFNQVTGINVHIITPVVCLVCIFYTSVGGLRAVVWTDVIQSFVMFGSMLLVIIKGTLDIGGLNVVWQRNLDSGRIELPNLELDPLSRHTIWGLIFGGFIYWLQTNAVNQTMLQRYLALPTLKSAIRALWIFIIGVLFLLGACCYSGMLIYATYHNCDPLTTKLARAKDQLLPLLVMDILGDFPGLPGLFLAGVFSAALSSLSTGLNSMAAVVLEDFYKPYFGKLSVTKTDLLMKTVVVIIGFICVGLAFLVEKMGAVLQLSMSLASITNGPSLGIFSMGLLLPWVNAKAALVGGLAGLAIMSWLCLNVQAAIATGAISFPEKPVTTEGCHYQFAAPPPPVMSLTLEDALNMTDISQADEVYIVFRLSYLWYTFMGAFVTMGVALLVSLCTEWQDPRDVDSALLAPFVRKLIKPRQFPHEPESPDDIIDAYAQRPQMKAEAVIHLQDIKSST